MDSLFAIKGKEFVVLAGESTVMHSIFKMKAHEDKSVHLDSNIVLALSGEQADRSNFGPFVQRNVQYYKFKNGVPLSVREAAHFTRTKLAEALRKGPYQVSPILAGVDERGAQIFWLDYLGTLAEVNYGAHGHAAYFVSSILSNFWKPNITEEEALEVVKLAIKELRTRYLVSQDNFIVKVIDKKGIRVLS